MFSRRAFPGGVHPHETGNGKWATNARPAVEMPEPELAAILLSQHVGAPCKSVVKTGDRVKIGQMIGEPSGAIAAPVHASISGKVKSIEPRVSAAGANAQAVVIENDHLGEWHESVTPRPNAGALGKTELLSIIREAGIVGLGGAAFPTTVKLNPPEGKKIDTVILNGAECEPYLTCDHRAMLDESAAIIGGLLIAKKIVGAENAIVAIEDNKPDAIEAMKRASEGNGIKVLPLKTRYPQGGEKQLIYAVTRREVPSGGLPMDAGALVINVSTAAAISDAVLHGRPIVKRTVTVTGAVKEPMNVVARIGTPIGELIDFCGGSTEGANKLVLGGPMMGIAAYDRQTPVVKATSGILLMEDEKPIHEGNCIRCARCVKHCPARIMPLELYRFSTSARFEDGKKNHAMDCIECGVCSYVCPAKLPLTQSIRVIKREITRRKL